MVEIKTELRKKEEDIRRLCTELCRAGKLEKGTRPANGMSGGGRPAVAYGLPTGPVAAWSKSRERGL